jgi:endonuclease/exonuclease/phosphatase family metal-dependent hydrolase
LSDWIGLARILTYNVHRCLGTDGKLSPARIAAVIDSCEPDIVALQELDVRRIRSGGVDQAHEIARELDMRHVHFHPALRVLEEEYGDAILTARPSKLVKAGALPGLATWHSNEPRGALWASVEVDGVEVQVINTHLGLRRAERIAQVETLLGPQWLGDPACRNPVIFLGDLNSVPRSEAYRKVARKFRDARKGAARGLQATYPSRYPFLALDHVFFGGAVEILRAECIRTPLSRIASDHLPVLVEFQLHSGERPAKTG